MTTETLVDAEPTYTTVQMVQLTGATYRQIDFWCREGYLPETAHGTGSQRSFTTVELDTTRLVVLLLAQGFKLDAAFEIADHLVADDRFTARLGDIWQLTISVIDTTQPDDRPAVDAPTSQEASE